MKKLFYIISFILFFSVILPTAPVHADITSGLVGWWKLDDSSGTSATDSSGNGNTGTLINNPAWATGKIDGALNFDGVNDYVNAGTPSTLNNLPALSISVWIKPDSLSNPGNVIVAKTHGATPTFTGWVLRTENPSGNHNSLYFSADFNRNLNDPGFDPGQDLIAVAEENVIEVGGWNHVVVTWDGSKIAANAKFYVNGSLVGKSPTHDKDINGDGTRSDDSYRPLIIGDDYQQPQGQPFDGLIDDVRIYNRVLSAVEIQAIYSNSFAEVKSVFYSAGQNTSDHKTGSPTVTLSSGVATFSVAQTAPNIGVGDRVTYNSTQKVFISGKISQTKWTVVTVKGDTPSNVSNATVNSIRHEFDSLNNAVSYYTGFQAGDANHLNSSNLISGNYILNIPLYYDTGPEYFTGGGIYAGILISGSSIVTGPNNYIRIYTPTNTASEVNLSQRHDGKWNNQKYSLIFSPDNDSTAAIRTYKPYVKIDGLQI